MFPVQPHLMGGGRRPSVSISDNNDFSPLTAIEESVVDPTDFDVRYSLYLSGLAYRYTLAGGNVAIPGEWLVNGVNSDYEVRATEVQQSGIAARTGTLNTWMVLSSDRTWRMTKTSGTGMCEWELTIEIRRASTGQVLDSANIMLRGEITL